MAKVQLSEKAVEMIYDYCLDHYANFECYPVDMEFYGQDSDEVICTIGLEQMLQALSEDQKVKIENQ